MINANELRIGNWVSANGESLQVYSIYEGLINISINSGVYASEIDGFSSFEPIPLTLEILEAQSWKRDFDDAYFIIPGDPVDVWIDKKSFEVILLMGPTESDIIIKLDYVHQLQNIYFALTNNELEITL